MSDDWANIGNTWVPCNPDEWKAAFSGKSIDMKARLILASLDSYRVQRLPMTVADTASMINVIVALQDDRGDKSAGD